MFEECGSGIQKADRLRLENRGFEDIVLVTFRRNRQPVEVEVRCDRAHDPALAWVGRHRDSSVVVRKRRSSGPAGFEVLQFVLEMEDDFVAGFHSQGGRLVPITIDVAVADGTVGHFLVADREVDLENAVLAAEVSRFTDTTANLGPRTSLCSRRFSGCCRSRCSETSRKCHEQQAAYCVADHHGLGFKKSSTCERPGVGFASRLSWG